MIKNIIALLLTLFLNSCSLENEKKLKISTTTWIGYTPLYYAKEKGWLEPLNIKLLNVVSLSENMYLYKAGNSDAYVGTQYEYNILVKKIDSLIPIMLFDKSNGGDVILGNISIEDIKNTTQRIDVYLEMDSINSILFEEFIKFHHIEDKNFNYINKDQAYISRLKNLENSSIIVTYTPYNVFLEKNGFKELSSTKNNLDLLVVDGMFTTKQTFNENKKAFIELKKSINNALTNLEKDPKEFYETVKAYLPDTTYEDFLKSLDDIVWINKNTPEKIVEKLNNNNFPTRELIK